MTLAQDHITVSRQMIRHAEEELAKGESLQASEKAWGAAVHQLKAIAQQRDWRHDGHYHLSQMSRRLAVETGDNDIRRLFSVAESLHANFYNIWKDEATVREDIEDVLLLLDKLTDIYEDGIQE